MIRVGFDIYLCNVFHYVEVHNYLDRSYTVIRHDLEFT